MSKSHSKWYSMKNVFLAIFFIMVFASLSAAAERRLGAVAGTNARAQAMDQASSQLGAGGPGTDLRAISSPRRPQTLTGFPAGTLPGDNIGSGGGGSGDDSNKPVGKAVFSGDPLSPIIGPEMIGSKLDRLCVIATHVGYTIGRRTFSPTVMDMPYTFALMNGNRRISTLYFNRSLTLMMVQ